MKPILFGATVLFYLLIVNIRAYGNNDDNAIARIYGNITDEKGYSGTGFFIKINNVPYVCTAFHVIAGVKKLSISCCDGDLQNLSVAAYDEKKDLALICFTISKGVSHIEYLSPLNTLPNSLTVLQGIVIGHPLTLVNQHVPVAFLSDKYTPSIEYSFFKLGLNLNLLSISTTLYNGMSGSPVIINHQVIGIISGSINQGGSITWAIPAYYISKMQILKSPITNFDKLPELDMLIGNKFNRLIRSYQYNNSIKYRYIPLERAGQEVKKNIEEYKQIISGTILLSTNMINALNNSSSFDELNTRSNSNDSTEVDNAPMLISFLNRHQQGLNSFITSLHDLRNGLNNIEYYTFRRQNGKFVDDEYSELIYQIDSLTSYSDTAMERIKVLGPITMKEARKGKRFNSFKKHGLEFFNLALDDVLHAKKLIELEYKLLDLTSIIASEMIECQSYNQGFD